MNIIRKLLAGAAILGTALAGVVAVTGTASASTVPVVYAASSNAWQASVKPGHFYFGQGVAPEFRNLNWTSWNGASAQATGTLWTVKPGCVPPAYKCAFNTRYVQVTLSTVHSRNGIRYYAHMAVRFYYGGKWHVVTGWLGSSGYWIFPPVYPYL
jgi:hypothetical protein